MSHLHNDPVDALVLSPGEMLGEMQDVNVLAPLVRCSKLPFRHLTSMYETHITHTPMILAAEFSRSQTARISDFSTSSTERGVFWMKRRRKDRSANELPQPITEEWKDATTFSSSQHGKGISNPNLEQDVSLSIQIPSQNGRRFPLTLEPPSKDHELVQGLVIAQFAASEGKSLADACEIVSVPYNGRDNQSPPMGRAEFIGKRQNGHTSKDVSEGARRRLVDGIDLNCGCPQPWAYSEGIGSALLRKPELVADMVRQVHSRMGDDFGISVKIRVDDNPSLTERLVQTAVHANITHLTIHGRTRHQASTEPVSLPKLKFAVECAKGQVPCVGNGDIWNTEDVHQMRRETGVQGVMAARGLLANPALFAGYETTPKHAVESFAQLAIDYGLPYNLYQRHVSYMLEGTMSKYDRLYLNSCGSYAGVGDWLERRGLVLSRETQAHNP